MQYVSTLRNYYVRKILLKSEKGRPLLMLAIVGSEQSLYYINGFYLYHREQNNF